MKEIITVKVQPGQLVGRRPRPWSDLQPIKSKRSKPICSDSDFVTKEILFLCI